MGERPPGSPSAHAAAVALVNQLGHQCAYTWLYDSETPICRKTGVHRFVCRLPRLRLAPGQYAVRVMLADRDHGMRDLRERICPFEVVMHGRSREGGWPVNLVAYFEDADWIVETGRPPE
jgi:hypothetical protein